MPAAASKSIFASAAARARGGPTLQCMEVWGGNQAIDTGLSVPGLDVWVYSRPHGDDAGGGDVHYVSQCSTGRIGRFLVADVSGHGAGVSEIASSLRNLMRRFVNYVDQSSLVGRMNREFTALAESGSFATAVVMTYWAPTDYLMLCNAGHPRPLWYSAKSLRWQTLDPAQENTGEIANLPLGILEPTTYDQVGLHLSPGDLVLVYTDSMIEAKDPAGRLLGEAGLRGLLNEIDAGEADAVVPRLIQAVERYRQGAPADDDMTVLLLRHNGSRPKRMSVGDWLTVAARFTKLVAESARSRIAVAPWPEVKAATLLGAISDRFNGQVGHKPPAAEHGSSPRGASDAAQAPRRG